MNYALKFPILYRRRRNEAPLGLDRGSQPYSNAVGIAKWLVESWRKKKHALGYAITFRDTPPNPIAYLKARMLPIT